ELPGGAVPGGPEVLRVPDVAGGGGPVHAVQDGRAGGGAVPADPRLPGAARLRSLLGGGAVSRRQPARGAAQPPAGRLRTRRLLLHRRRRGAADRVARSGLDPEAVLRGEVLSRRRSEIYWIYPRLFSRSISSPLSEPASSESGFRRAAIASSRQCLNRAA